MERFLYVIHSYKDALVFGPPCIYIAITVTHRVFRCNRQDIST